MIKKITAYALYFTGVTVLFLYLLFPSDTVKHYIIYQFSDIAPEVELHIERVRPALPPGLSLANAYILLNDETVLRVDGIAFRPYYLSLLSTEPTFNFTGTAAGGQFSGTIQMLKGDGNHSFAARTHFADIDLQSVQLTAMLHPRSVSGTMRGDIDYAGPLSGKGTATVEIVGMQLTFEETLPGLDSLTFSRVNTTADLDQDRVTFNQIEMEGSHFSASGRGTLTLRQPIEASHIDLRGTAQVHPELIRTMGPLLPRQYLREGRVPIRITGTLANPRYAFR